MSGNDRRGNTTKTEQLFSLLSENGYNINCLQYPSDLTSEQHGHFIMFLINVNASAPNLDGGKFVEDKEINKESLKNAPDIFQRSISRRDQETATSKKSREAVGSANRTKRINKVLSLYMPELNTITYGMDYENTDLGAARALGFGALDQASIRNTFDPQSLSEQNVTIQDKITNTLQGFKDFSKQSALTGAFGETIRNATSANLRQARNPHMEFLFRGVRQRRFSFEFIFTPRSEAEAKNIYNIIREFKLNSHPEIQDKQLGIFMDFPAEFDILFISNGKENQYLHKMSTSVLESVTINYNQAGVNSMHKEIELDNGNFGAAPTHINMRLDFAELELLSKQRIREGF